MQTPVACGVSCLFSLVATVYCLARRLCGTDNSLRFAALLFCVTAAVPSSLLGFQRDTEANDRYIVLLDALRPMKHAYERVLGILFFQLIVSDTEDSESRRDIFRN